MGAPKIMEYGNKRKKVFLMKLDDKQEEEKNGNAQNCNSGSCCHAAHWRTDLMTVTVIVAPQKHYLEKR